VQRLQIQLFICFNWDEPRRRSLHGLGYGMGISEVILVSLSKRLSICRRDLLHIVAKRCKLSSDVGRCHACFDAN
jgi:xanthine dehydrogenase molybdopterin-binding subunit B